jgi:hypothetical protein
LRTVSSADLWVHGPILIAFSQREGVLFKKNRQRTVESDP